MDSGYYAAYAGLAARSDALDIAAGNLANAGTSGYRAERDTFRSALLGSESPDSQLGETVNNFGVLGGSLLDLGQGALTSTGNPLDLAIEGQGFLAIQTSQGTRYTRDGALERAQNGMLTTRAGEPVLDAGGQPIVVPAGPMVVGADGSVSVNGAVAGKLGLISFANPAALTAEGADRYAAAEGAAKIPGSGTFHQGALEGSNQDVIAGSLQLVLMQRQAEMMQKAVSVFSNDLDKTASEDLPRVQ